MKLRNLKFFYPLLLAYTLLHMSFKAFSEEAKELHWTGCGISKKAFMEDLAIAFEKSKGIKVLLSAGGAAKGIRNTATKKSDLGGSCRHKIVKNGAFLASEADSHLIRVAWDAIVVIVNSDNILTNISKEDLKGIFSGTITNWKYFQGSDKEIVPLIRSGNESGVGYMARLLLFDNPDYEYKAKFETMLSTSPIEKKIGTDKFSIAIDGISSAKKAKNTKILNLDGIEPTKLNIQNGKYPYFRPLYIAINKDELDKSMVRQFIDFALSTEGQAVISKAGTINLKEGQQLTKLWDEKMKSLNIKQESENGYVFH